MTNPQRYPAVSAEYRKRHSPGLENDEFDVWYQPIVNADTLMEGVEALLRWPRRPEGPLPPDVFIGIAESSGLIMRWGSLRSTGPAAICSPSGN
jgi:sensor c-di-GMP phosphodiesterase-like protein